MALQELCLAEITKSIESYYQAYSTWDNEDLQWRFQYLQGFYSHKFAELLDKEDLLQEKYSDLVFNKRLASIRTKWFSTFSLEAIVQAFDRIGPTLQKVIFDEIVPTGVPWEGIICFLPNVRAIKYEYSCNNAILRRISEHCPRLESLTVFRSAAVTDDGLQYFCPMEEENENQEERLPCPHLKEIFLQGTSVTDDGVKQLLKNVPSLERIDYEYLAIVLHKIHKNDLGSLDQVRKYNLTHLSLNCCYFTEFVHYDDVLKVCVTVCPNLTCFQCYLLKLEHLNLCSVLPDLEKLDLWRFGNTPIDVSDFLREKGGKLTSLTLRKCTVSLSALARSCIRLNELIMDDVITQYSNKIRVYLDIIPRFYNLEEFSVEEVDLSDSSNCKSIGRILSFSPVLRKFTFQSSSVLTSEAKAEILKGCEQSALNYISALFHSAERKFIEDILLRCCMLECLDLAFTCDISEEFEDSLRTVAESLPNRPRISID